MATSASPSLDTPSLVDNVSAVQEGSGGGDAAGPDPFLSINSTPVLWPSETNLVFTGRNRLSLTNQSPLIRALLHDTFEGVRAFLLFDHSFPDAVAIPGVLKDCLLTAASESHNPMAPYIHARLTKDEEYMCQLGRLVSAL